ncbi:SET domain-containing protein SmydA-8-like [Tribolium madens]|uniref:SET domain-containing protein SmydA-8-like n=1 Tax=Tribolium madens TaxID=41895 RepID=UPI001CF7259B|nr:SET domain-containing protein SmydA-8-like [Tribolium madens]XP_044252837.1 SET domain-containing protein SmydA-8-like [Tribolium madens]
MSEKSENNLAIFKQPTLQLCLKCGLESNCFCDFEAKHVVCQTTKPYLIKTIKNVSTGEIIFNEFPLIFGPRLDYKSNVKLCIGCCKHLFNENKTDCPKCSLPFCSLDCDGFTSRHDFECSIFKLRQFDQNFKYCALVPLRTLFLQNTNVVQWQKIFDQFEVELSKDFILKNNDEIEQYVEQNFLIPLRQQENETKQIILEDKSKETLEKIIYFLQSNTHNDKDLIFFYPTASLLKQSCTSNTTFTIENSKITVRAISDISEDTPLTCSYTNIFIGTHARIEDLKKINKTCFCARCNDPSEFGTFFSALKCIGTKQDSCGGNQLPVNPTNEETLWVCNKCKIELPHKQIVQFVKHLGGQLEKTLAKKVSIEELEEFLGKLLMFLHPNHFYIFAVKNILIKLYGEESLATKIQICEELIEIVEKFEDGGLLLGKLLYELFVSKASILVENRNVEELTTIIEKMRKIGQVHQDRSFLQILQEAESKFDSM